MFIYCLPIRKSEYMQGWLLDFLKKVREKFGGMEESLYLCNRSTRRGRLAQLV